MFSTILGLIGIPTPQKLIAMALASVVVFGIGFGTAWKVQTWRQKAAVVDAQKQVIVQTAKDDAVTEQVSQQAEQHQVDIQTQIRRVIVHVPVYVTNTADARCVVPVGFVRLHNDAATVGVPPVPATTGKPHAVAPNFDAPSGIPLSTVGATVADNYGTCNATRQQLIDLQAWVKDQQAAQAH